MKTIRTTIGALVLFAFGAMSAQAAEEFKGNWTLSPGDEAGQVRFGLIHRHDGGRAHHESDWPARLLQGLDVAARGKRDVRFFIERDAGRFDCQGYLEDGEGAGTFRFTPDANFAQGMRELGFTGIDEQKQFAMAVHDVTLEFARAMKGERLIDLDTDKLIAFRIFDVTSQFIRELRTEGLPAMESNRLIAFRVHRVTPALVREVRRNGYQADENQLIAMRVHGVTPEFIADLKARGMRDLTIDQLVSLKIHGID